MQISCNPSDLFSPGENGERAEIRNTTYVRVVRPLTHIATCKASKAGAIACEFLYVRNRDQLSLGRTGQLHEGTEKVLDFLFSKLRLYFVDHRVFGPLSGIRLLQPFRQPALPWQNAREKMARSNAVSAQSRSVRPCIS